MQKGITITLRSLWRQKEFSFLNILGLGVGIGSALLIFILIRNELSVDTYHKNRDRIYRVVSTETYRNGTTDWDGCAPIPLAVTFRQEFPQAEAVAATQRTWKQFLLPSVPGGTDKVFKSAEIFYTEPSLFRIFDFTWLEGNPETALGDMYTMVISRSVAQTWFGRWQDAMGKTVLEGDEHNPYRITGVVEDPPANSDLNMKIFLSYITFQRQHTFDFTDPRAWDNFSVQSQCFFMLKKGVTIQSMNALLPGFVARHFTPLFAHSDTRDSCFFQPLREMHFNEEFAHYGPDGWSYTELWSLGLIGLFLLMVACINFVNLATAQSLNRAKEVGVRKVLGSNRGQLMTRFMGETAFLVGIALVLGCIFAELAFSPLNGILGKEIPLKAFIALPTFGFLLTAGILVTVLSGLYPSLVLSGFNPITAIKSKVSARMVGGISLRRGLVVLQFVIAQLLIIATLVIVRQMHFFRTRPMGFDRKAIVLAYMPGLKDQKTGLAHNAYLVEQARQIPGVLSATLCSEPPATNGYSSGLFTFDNDPQPKDFEVSRRFADSAYLTTFHMSLVAGRMPFPSDTMRETLVNESMVKRLGIRSPEQILGKTIHFGQLTEKGVPIVGVLKDFINASLKDKIYPMAMSMEATNYEMIAVRMDPERIAQVMPRLQSLFTQVYPENVFDPSFFDDRVVSFYHTQAIEATLFEVFAGLAIFISCLGLYGLVSFMAAQKTKEVGIRKVLGASVRSIVYLFSKEFTLLIGVAFAIATPLGYYFMNQWLNKFIFHINVGWAVFALSILLSMLIAWATVGYRAIRAALADPAKALKYE
jgi:putative ABC transport system permease protein